MPWVKMEHSEVWVNPVPTCGVCGRVTSDPMYQCADGWCPYPAAPPPAPTPSEEAETPVQASESQVTPEATSEQPPPDAAPAPGEPQPA